MAEITCESEWLASNDLLDLARYLRGRVVAQRFRWLACEWGNQIWDLADPMIELGWFAAFFAWVHEGGPHPAEVCEQRGFDPLGRYHEPFDHAISFVMSLQDNDLLLAVAYAGCSIIAGPHHYSTQLDFHHTPRVRPARTRAEVSAFMQAAWEESLDVRAERRSRLSKEFCDLFRDVAGNPFRPVSIEPEWRTSTVVAIAKGIEHSSAFDRLPILADALQDSGCEDEQLLQHCRGAGTHFRGCWVVELFSQG